jgi:hypothetical protein
MSGFLSVYFSNYLIKKTHANFPFFFFRLFFNLFVLWMKNAIWIFPCRKFSISGRMIMAFPQQQLLVGKRKNLSFYTCICQSKRHLFFCLQKRLRFNNKAVLFPSKNSPLWQQRNNIVPAKSTISFRN